MAQAKHASSDKGAAEWRQTMAKYEVIREIFNNCSGNQMRDVDIQEMEVEDVDAHARSYATDPEGDFERIEARPGTTIYNITNFGLPERLSYTRIEA
jgi:hypothetical protein